MEFGKIYLIKSLIDREIAEWIEVCRNKAVTALVIFYYLLKSYYHEAIDECVRVDLLKSEYHFLVFNFRPQF